MERITPHPECVFSREKSLICFKEDGKEVVVQSTNTIAYDLSVLNDHEVCNGRVPKYYQIDKE
jgi:hypothetical protein